MNASFRYHVTSAAFCLTLSKMMIRRLLMMDYHLHFYFDGHPHNLKTLHSLQERGLVERREEVLHVVGQGTFFQKPLWVLTEEGVLVVKLLKCAGYTLENDEAFQRFAEMAKQFGVDKVT